MKQQIFAGPSGHKLSYDLLGTGRHKIIFFHGFPGSREQGRVLEPHCAKLDLQVLAFDRPGYGHSDFTKFKTVADLSQHIIPLADHLGWDKFHLVGVSGGAPHALSMAKVFPDRVLTMNIVCGLGPLSDKDFSSQMSPHSRHVMQVANILPTKLIDYLVKRRIQKLAKMSSAKKTFFRGLDSGDVQALNSPAVRGMMMTSLANAFRLGAQGAKQDIALYLKPWPQDWTSIKCEMHFWHGDRDTLVPPELMASFGRKLPSAKLHLIHGEGHYTLPLRRAGEILEPITKF